jgi:4-amino-4-deoxy-L-arabinose transferase-like glycosyltransferase
MSETKTSDPARLEAPAQRREIASLSAATIRKAMTAFGAVLVVINLVLTTSVPAGPMAAVLWGVAALCFLGAFVVYMREPAGKSGEGAADVRRGAGKPTPGEASTVSTQEGQGERAPSGAGLPRQGNPLRLVRGGVTASVASFLAFTLMANAVQLRWGVPLGALFVGIATWGAMDLLGTFDDPDDRMAGATGWQKLVPSLGSLVAGWLLFCACLAGAQSGRMLPQPAWGALVTLTFLATVVALFEVGRTLGVWATDRPVFRHHGFWVVAGAAVLYLPFMGSSSLWDPWETHYGEVTREMLSRDDWISLWWAQDGWFWSKPVLDMWMQAIAMATLGTRYQPDKMLIGDASRPLMHPEWAVRVPVVLFAILALYFLYKGVAKTFGPRAALLGALVLATMPDWYFLTHQTMTDMPFVGPMTACLGLVLIGLRTPEDVLVRAYEVRLGAARRVRLTAWHLVFGAVLLCALPQILYLFSRNFELSWRPGAHGFRPHWDEFRSGSGGGNCGLPGNEECRLTLPASIPRSTGATPTSIGGIVVRTVGAFEPALQALLWTALLGVLLYMNWGERRAKRLLYLAAWLFAAISTLGKGPAGFGLPALVTLAFLAAAGPGEDLVTRLQRIGREIMRFEIVGGLLLIIPAVALPWYIAMYVRHGPPFTDRLIFHDMFNRAFHHVHDTNEGDDTSFRFYIWQLGYAFFPWTGLAPLGLLWWLRRGASQTSNEKSDTAILLCFWFVFAFALFSFMGTKFHHYIFPAIPPVAMLIGVVLDDMLGGRRIARAGGLVPYLAGVAGGVTLMVFGVARTQAGSFFGTKLGGRLADPSPATGAVILALGAVLAVGSILVFRCREEERAAPPDGQDERHTSRMLAAGAIAGALLLLLVARDLIIKPDNADQPGAIRLLQLFTYNYRRAWPDSLDFAAALAGFGVVGVLLSIALAVRAIRPHATVAMCAFAFVWGLWGSDVYMPKTAPHWGQHEVIEAYYANRAGPEELLVAYQMNWKGENFYTGNHIPAFVSTGSTFTNWLKKKRDEGARVMYFVTEHGRIGGLKSEVAGKAYREVTDKTLCNKFVLVRAEL